MLKTIMSYTNWKLEITITVIYTQLTSGFNACAKILP